MESEVLEERIEWEAERIAAAFAVRERNFYEHGSMSGYSGKNAAGTSIDWGFSSDGGRLERIFVGGIPRGTHIRIVQGEWKMLLMSCHREIMTRGLYCLGFEDEAVFDQLGGLTAHEKLELRLTLPREFWPKTWMDEEENAAK